MQPINRPDNAASDISIRHAENRPDVQGTSPLTDSFANALGQAIQRQGDDASKGNPRHFPVSDAGPSSKNFMEMALGIRAYRQQLIASNIANADTPGYKAIDIDLNEAMKKAQYTTGSFPGLATTSPSHIASDPAGGSYKGVAIKYQEPNQISADGNTVEMDVERSKFSDNAIMYQFTLDRVGGEFKHMLELLRDLK